MNDAQHFVEMRLFLLYNYSMLMLSHVQLFVTPGTVACQTFLSMGFSRQEYWNGLLLPPPGDLPNPGIKPTFPVAPALQVDSLPLSHWGSPYMHST